MFERFLFFKKLFESLKIFSFFLEISSFRELEKYIISFCLFPPALLQGRQSPAQLPQAGKEQSTVSSVLSEIKKE
jgi:hypothetical protein